MILPIEHGCFRPLSEKLLVAVCDDHCRDVGPVKLLREGRLSLKHEGSILSHRWKERLKPHALPPGLRKHPGRGAGKDVRAGESGAEGCRGLFSKHDSRDSKRPS